MTCAAARVAMEMPFSVPPMLSGAPKSRDTGAVHGKLQPALGGGKGDRRRQTSGIVAARQDHSAALVPAARSRRPRCAAWRCRGPAPAWRSDLSDFGLPRQRERWLALGLQRLFDLGLLLLPLPRPAARSADDPATRRRDRAPAVLLVGDLLAERIRSARSAASVAASRRMSGRTAPSIMAVRTDCSASSGRTMIAGGGWWPIRCSAARTSAMTARRPSSDGGYVRSLSSSVLRRPRLSAMRSSMARIGRRCRSGPGSACAGPRRWRRSRPSASAGSRWPCSDRRRLLRVPGPLADRVWRGLGVDRVRRGRRAEAKPCGRFAKQLSGSLRREASIHRVMPRDREGNRHAR